MFAEKRKTKEAKERLLTDRVGLILSIELNPVAN